MKSGKGVNRNLTNLGLFRVYLNNYLLELPQINANMTLVVRQLSPSEKGVPMEVYCFSKVKTMAEYETLQADIFDHVFALVKEFELDIFESPSNKATVSAAASE